MPLVGFHASHEQIHPGALLTAVQRAEQAGFQAAMCSDHFAPWLPEQGHSGFAWSWLAAALESTRLEFGVVTAPGQRYHPAIIAQAMATLAAMYPGRFWAALGSGEAMNEHITGDAWPEKPVRDARLVECVDVIRRLLAGDEVSVDGLVTVDRARVWSLPEEPPAIFAAAVSVEKAASAATWADGLITVAQPPEQLRSVVDAYRDSGGSGPVCLQVHLSYAATEDEALAVANEQWRNGLVPPLRSWDLDDPSDFVAETADAAPDAIRGPVFVSADVAAHLAHLESLASIGFDRLYLHHVGRDQDRFIDVFGAEVLPQLAGVHA
ncbi:MULTISPECIES: TIGR03885 family FMN-dependent LLM class oxidoreductase [unclassified Leifsonia]|uniref:TIGR03885 family FMN-dependent LLM class oxidoreductase n=1 Tax=unclassified Leifsonia TaxID=2663824 RepID=UPI0006FE9DC2|nr:MULTISPECIES: TIGR03885 family FMN-dependent LLM class oxidoreductase [unclassified Leifsonia]KQX05368.1 LLM class F420-dependent oxidoreductase [Leifsonia sp. Root1293]KRA09001.1 LLM class F420-dependent oxidoreductase [Leifsonia sp. Root60]